MKKYESDFTIISREEYNKLIENEQFALRSCWNCNSGHERLKNVDYIIRCFVCGLSYYKGKHLKVKGSIYDQQD